MGKTGWHGTNYGGFVPHPHLRTIPAPVDSPAHQLMQAFHQVEQSMLECADAATNRTDAARGLQHLGAAVERLGHAQDALRAVDPHSPLLHTADLVRDEARDAMQHTAAHEARSARGDHAEVVRALHEVATHTMHQNGHAPDDHLGVRHEIRHLLHEHAPDPHHHGADHGHGGHGHGHHSEAPPAGAPGEQAAPTRVADNGDPPAEPFGSEPSVAGSPAATVAGVDGEHPGGVPAQPAGATAGAQPAAVLIADNQGHPAATPDEAQPAGSGDMPADGTQFAADEHGADGHQFQDPGGHQDPHAQHFQDPQQAQDPQHFQDPDHTPEGMPDHAMA